MSGGVTNARRWALLQDILCSGTFLSVCCPAEFRAYIVDHLQSQSESATSRLTEGTIQALLAYYGDTTCKSHTVLYCMSALSGRCLPSGPASGGGVIRSTRHLKFGSYQGEKAFRWATTTRYLRMQVIYALRRAAIVEFGILRAMEDLVLLQAYASGLTSIGSNGMFLERVRAGHNVVAFAEHARCLVSISGWSTPVPGQICGEHSLRKAPDSAVCSASLFGQIPLVE